jgi:hypothetical protein
VVCPLYRVCGLVTGGAEITEREMMPLRDIEHFDAVEHHSDQLCLGLPLVPADESALQEREGHFFTSSLRAFLATGIIRPSARTLARFQDDVSTPNP